MAITAAIIKVLSPNSLKILASKEPKKGPKLDKYYMESYISYWISVSTIFWSVFWARLKVQKIDRIAIDNRVIFLFIFILLS